MRTLRLAAVAAVGMIAGEAQAARIVAPADPAVIEAASGTHCLTAPDTFPGDATDLLATIGTAPAGSAARLDTFGDAAPAAIDGVPETATWAMMVLGFSGLGYALRRPRRTELRIRFA